MEEGSAPDIKINSNYNRSQRIKAGLIIVIIFIAAIIFTSVIYYFMSFSPGACTQELNIALEKSYNSYNWTLTCYNSHCSEEILLSEYAYPIVIVKKANGLEGLHMNLNNMTSGHWYNGVQFNNVENTEKIDPGDFFVLDRSIYHDYSTFTIVGLVHVNLIAD